MVSEWKSECVLIHVAESQTTRQDLDLKAGTSGQGETFGKKACQLVVQPNRELTLVKRAGFPRPCQADYKAFWPRQFGPGAHVMASQKHWHRWKSFAVKWQELTQPAPVGVWFQHSTEASAANILRLFLSCSGMAAMLSKSTHFDCTDLLISLLGHCTIYTNACLALRPILYTNGNIVPDSYPIACSKSEYCAKKYVEFLNPNIYQGLCRQERLMLLDHTWSTLVLHLSACNSCDDSLGLSDSCCSLFCV